MHILQPDSPLTEAAAKYEKSSGRKYRNGSNSARTFDKLMGKMQPSEITLEIVEKFAAKMKAKGYVKTSIDRTVGDVKLFVRFITGVSLTPPSPPVDAEEIHPETVSILRWAHEYCQVNNLARRTPVYTANRFVRMIGNLRVAAITTNDLCDFRKAQQAAGMSPATIESSIGDIQTMVKAATGVVVNPGKRLKRNRPQPRGVSLAHIEATWPHLETWMQQWVVLTFWTCLRIADAVKLMHSLTDRAPDVLEWQASKTGHVHRWPVLPWVEKYLTRRTVPWNQPNDHAWKSVREQLTRACIMAGVPRWTPKLLRQFALTQWMRTDAGAGQVIHGCGLHSVLKHYIDPLIILEDAAKRIKVPSFFLSEEDKPKHDGDIVTLLSQLSEAQQSVLRETIKAMSSLAR